MTGKTFLLAGASTFLLALTILFALTLCGCAGSFEEAAKPRLAMHAAAAPRDAARCASLDDGHRAWSAVAKGSAFLASGSGLSVIPIPSDEKTARIAVASGAVVAAGLAAVSVFVADDFAAAWSRECVAP